MELNYILHPEKEETHLLREFPISVSELGVKIVLKPPSASSAYAA